MPGCPVLSVVVKETNGTDYDLYVVVEDASLDSFLNDRPSLYDSLGTVVHLQDEIPGGNPKTEASTS